MCYKKRKNHCQPEIFLLTAPVIIGPGTDGSEIEDSITPGNNQNCKVRIPKQGTTVKVINQNHKNRYCSGDLF